MVLKDYFCKRKFDTIMLIIDIKETDSIEKALRKYKRKFNQAGILKELRSRKHYTKPSARKRNQMLKAAYKQKAYGNQ